MLIPLAPLVALYLCFHLKHWLCDYPLQRPWMVSGKGAQQHWALPLLAHAAVHAAGTLLIVGIAAPSLWWLALIDGAIHFTVDRIKASPALGGRWNPSQSAFWWALGADQAAHHLTHFGLIMAILLLW
jgi:hypothetical protein